MKALKQILLGPLMFLKVRWTKYLVYSILTFLVVPVLTLLDYYFRGAFVGTVEYLGSLVPYFLFILVGYIFSRLTFSVFDNTYFIFQQQRPVLVFKTVHPLVVPVSMSLLTFINVLIGLIPVSLGLILLNTNPAFLFVSLFLAYAFGFPLVFGIGVLLAALALIIRGRDFRALVNLFNRALWILFPTMFGINAFPSTFQPVAIYIPTIALVEGVRRLVLGLGGLDLITYSFMSGMAVLALSLLIFKRAFNSARKTGKILLR